MERQAGASRARVRRATKRKRLSSGVQILDLVPARPPCSHAEHDMAVVIQRRLRAFGWRPATELIRAPTSPTWPPLLRALFRVWGAAFLAAAWAPVAIGLGVASVLGGV